MFLGRGAGEGRMGGVARERGGWRCPARGRGRRPGQRPGRSRRGAGVLG